VQEVISSRKRRRIANDDTLRTIPPDALTIYTDGACVDNGKAGARAGYGVFFMDNDSRNRSARVPGTQTNQRGELFAVLKALETIHLDHGRYLARQVFILTDSMYTINALTRWGQSWERNQWVTSTGQTVISKDIISRARELLRLLDNQGVRVQFNHVRSHTGMWGNEQADGLARKGAMMPEVIEWIWDKEFDDNELENELMESLEYEDEELDEIIAEWDS
jgi:ribonuclease HI